MSWSINLTADAAITIDDAGEIVAELPPELRKHAHRNDWGWTAATDIDLPEGTLWHIGGAGYSRDISGHMARALAAGLRARGYRVKVGERRD